MMWSPKAQKIRLMNIAFDNDLKPKTKDHEENTFTLVNSITLKARRAFASILLHVVHLTNQMLVKGQTKMDLIKSTYHTGRVCFPLMSFLPTPSVIDFTSPIS